MLRPIRARAITMITILDFSAHRLSAQPNANQEGRLALRELFLFSLGHRYCSYDLYHLITPPCFVPSTSTV
jgi:hypothetical protein